MFFGRPQSAFAETQDRTLHYEHHNCGAAGSGHPSPPPACGGALRQIWEMNWFKAFLMGLFHNPAMKEGKGGLEDHVHLHCCVMHHLGSHSRRCVRAGSRAVVFSPRAERESLCVAQRCKEKAGLALNRTTPVRHPAGTQNVCATIVGRCSQNAIWSVHR